MDRLENKILYGFSFLIDCGNDTPTEDLTHKLDLLQQYEQRLEHLLFEHFTTIKITEIMGKVLMLTTASFITGANFLRSHTLEARISYLSLAIGFKALEYWRTITHENNKDLAREDYANAFFDLELHDKCNFKEP